MKKLLATVMAVTMSVSLAACGTKNAGKTDLNPAKTKTTIETVESEQAKKYDVKTGTFAPVFTTGISEGAEMEGVMINICGGYEVNQGNTLIEANPEAKAAFEKATECLAGGTYEPIAYLGRQIVAGTNYSFLCRMTPSYPGFEGRFVVVVVYQDLEGNAQITNVNEIDISASEIIEEETEQETEEKFETMDTGNWVETEDVENVISDDDKEKIDS